MKPVVQRRAARAFTMVEIMIVAGLFLIIMAGTLTVYIMCQKSWYATSLQMETTRGASLAVSRMVYGVGTNGGLRECSYARAVTNMDGIWTGTNYPPAADDTTHHIVPVGGPAPNPSWRLVCSNFAGGVNWYDYNRAASNIVFWRNVSNAATRELVANYVADASVVWTNRGSQVRITVSKHNGNYFSSVTNTTFVKLRN